MNNDLIVSGMEGKQSGMFSPLNLHLQIWRTNPQSSKRDSHQRREGGRGQDRGTKARVGPLVQLFLLLFSRRNTVHLKLSMAVLAPISLFWPASVDQDISAPGHRRRANDPAVRHTSDRPGGASWQWRPQGGSREPRIPVTQRIGGWLDVRRAEVHDRGILMIYDNK